jgi:CreA protein
MTYSDKLIEGSPKNSTSTVPIEPWGGGEVQKCADFLRWEPSHCTYEP